MPDHMPDHKPDHKPGYKPDPEHHGLRDQILNSARRLFIERGYRGLSMREIAESVGVSKAALYYHFKDKEQLFRAILDEYLAEMEALLAVIQGEGGPARDQIGRLVRSILSQPPGQRAVIRLASQETAHLSPAARQAVQAGYQERFLGPVQDILRAGMERGELRPLDPQAAAWALLGMIYPYSYPVQPGSAAAPLEAAGLILTIFLDGLAV